MLYIFCQIIIKNNTISVKNYKVISFQVNLKSNKCINIKVWKTSKVMSDLSSIFFPDTMLHKSILNCSVILSYYSAFFSNIIIFNYF